MDFSNGRYKNARLAEMNSVMTDKHFLMHLINNLTSEYEYTVALVEKRLDDSKNPITLEELRSDLNLRYERLGLRKGNYEEKDHDLALGAFNKFKGKCRKCGRIGHKGKDCKSTGSSTGTAATGFHLPNKNNFIKNKMKLNADGWTQVRG